MCFVDFEVMLFLKLINNNLGLKISTFLKFYRGFTDIDYFYCDRKFCRK